mmetsp:Transcript_9997/g.41985  ORF Transcript_9997/g.41985 Transcript_9997/m.41985 type:complete len:346 (-) Transcript_9997:809-1846(-)
MSFALPSSLGEASADRCGYTAKISSPRQTSGVRSRACRGTPFPRIQSFSFTRLECPDRNASPGCRNRSRNAHTSGRFSNRTPSSELSVDAEFSQDARTNQPGGCVMETPRPASMTTSFPTARASASPSPSFASDVCFPSFAPKSRRGFFAAHARDPTLHSTQSPRIRHSHSGTAAAFTSAFARAKRCAHILRRTWYSMSTPAQSETYARSWSSRASVGSLHQASRSISPRIRYDLSKGEADVTGPSPSARYAEGTSSSSSRRCALCSVNASMRASTPPSSTSSRSKGISSARTRFRRYFGDALLGSSRHVSARDSRNATSSRFANDKSGRPKTPSRGRMPATRDM